MSLNAVGLTRARCSEQHGHVPARASKETSSSASGRSLRGLLVSPKAWITRSKIARYVLFWGIARLAAGR